MGVTIEIELSNEMIERIADRIILKKEFTKINPKEQIHTVAEVAKTLKKSSYTIRRYIKSGILKAEKPGKSYHITNTNLNNYIHGNSH